MGRRSYSKEELTLVSVDDVAKECLAFAKESGLISLGKKKYSRKNGQITGEDIESAANLAAFRTCDAFSKGRLTSDFHLIMSFTKTFKNSLLDLFTDRIATKRGGGISEIFSYSIEINRDESLTHLFEETYDQLKRWPTEKNLIPEDYVNDFLSAISEKIAENGLKISKKALYAILTSKNENDALLNIPSGYRRSDVRKSIKILSKILKENTELMEMFVDFASVNKQEIRPDSARSFEDLGFTTVYLYSKERKRDEKVIGYSIHYGLECNKTGKVYKQTDYIIGEMRPDLLKAQIKSMVSSAVKSLLVETFQANEKLSAEFKGLSHYKKAA